MNSNLDLIIRVKNGYLAQRETIVAFYSRVNESIVKILKDEKFIKDFSIEDREGKKQVSIKLLYIDKSPALSEVNIFSKPGRRIYKKVKELKPVVNGMGIAILSTPKGLMTNKKAHKEKIGGEFLFELW